MGGKKFTFWSNTFSGLCNDARDLQGARNGPNGAKKKNKNTST